MVTFDPSITASTATKSIKEALGALDTKNRDYIALQQLFNAIPYGGVTGLMKTLETIIGGILVEPTKEIQESHKPIFKALELLSVNASPVELKIIKSAIPALAYSRETPVPGPSNVAAFQSKFKRLGLGNTENSALAELRAPVNVAMSNGQPSCIDANGAVTFVDEGKNKKIKLIQTGNMGAVFLVTDDKDRPLKVIKTISAADSSSNKPGDSYYPNRRINHFRDYQMANAPGVLLTAGNFQVVSDENGRDHTVETLGFCEAPNLKHSLGAKTIDPLQAFTGVASSLVKLHETGVIATNLKPENIHIKAGEGAQFVNPSMFRHHSNIFGEYFAGSTHLRYLGDDYMAAFKGDTACQTKAVAAKTDLWAFAVNLFQSLVPADDYLFNNKISDRLSTNVNSKDLISNKEKKIPAASSQIEGFLAAADRIAPQFQAHGGNFVRNIYSWAASGEQAKKEIQTRLDAALTGRYSVEKIAAIKSLLENLLVFKEVDGKQIMALDNQGTAPTAEWVHKQMQEIAKP